MDAAATADRGVRQGAFLTLLFCFLIATIEGIDLQSMGIAAPALKPEFGLSNGQLGYVLAASPIGLFFGAFIGGRLADHIGRKMTLIIAMAVFGAFQLCTVWAPGFEAMMAIRFLTGLGLGGALPNLIALTAEAAGGKGRIINVVITAAGMPTGGALAAAIMFFGGANADWRVVFYLGGIAPLLLAPLIALALPESKMFREAKAAVKAAGTRVNTFKTLFGDGRWLASLLLWVGFFFTTIVTYLLLNWLPVLMVAKGFSRHDASFIQILFNVGAAVGSIFLGWLMQRRPSRTVLFACYAGLALALLALTVIGRELAIASTVAAVTGGFLLGAQYILYGLSPSFYRTANRGTGTGAAVAAGRLGSAVGPYLAGVLLSEGQSATQVLQALLPVTAVAAVAAILLMFCKPAQE